MGRGRKRRVQHVFDFIGVSCEQRYLKTEAANISAAQMGGKSPAHIPPGYNGDLQVHKLTSTLPGIRDEGAVTTKMTLLSHPFRQSKVLTSTAKYGKSERPRKWGSQCV